MCPSKHSSEGCGLRLPGYVHRPADLLPLFAGIARDRVGRFMVVAIGAGGRISGVCEVGRGNSAWCQAPTREVFRFLLDVDAHRGIVAHNHPTGDLAPSARDRLLTAHLAILGQVLGLPIVDHMIVAGARYRSFLAEGWMPGTDLEGDLLVDPIDRGASVSGT